MRMVLEKHDRQCLSRPEPPSEDKGQTRKSKAAHVSLSSDNNVKQQGNPRSRKASNRHTSKLQPNQEPKPQTRQNTRKTLEYPETRQYFTLGAQAVQTTKLKKQNTAAPAATVPAAPPSMKGDIRIEIGAVNPVIEKSSRPGSQRCQASFSPPSSRLTSRKARSPRVAGSLKMPEPVQAGVA